MFNFHIEKYIHYVVRLLSKYQTCVAGCGQDKMYMTEVDQHLTALHNIKSKHINTRVNVGNSEDGLYLQLLSHRLKKEVMCSWKSIKPIEVQYV